MTFWATLRHGEFYIHFLNHQPRFYSEIRMAIPNCNPKHDSIQILFLLIAASNKVSGWGRKGLILPLPSFPNLPAIDSEYSGVERARVETLKGRRRFFSLNWHCYKMASCTGGLADVKSSLLVSWALLWVHQLHPCWAPWLQIL